MKPESRIIQGECVEVMRTFPDSIAQTCVTSPPYFGLRSYLPAGHPDKAWEIGAENTPQEYIAKLVAVFREIRRVLSPDGTLWLNLGDSYDKDKQLRLMPHRVAMALQDDGWILRSAIVWKKNRIRPESAANRPTNCYEMLFLFGSTHAYYFDVDAIREKCSETSHGSPNINPGQKAAFRKDGGSLGLWTKGDKLGGRRPRNVWTIEQTSFKGSHCAVMPPDLAERCIMAGSRPGDVVLDPFGGAGTTGLAAKHLGRGYILCELDAKSVEMARERIAASDTVEVRKPPAIRKTVPAPRTQLPLDIGLFSFSRNADDAP